MGQTAESATETAQFGALCTISNQMCFYVVKTQKQYDGARDCITNSSSYYKHLWETEPDGVCKGK